jgi:hypothetical protein
MYTKNCKGSRDMNQRRKTSKTIKECSRIRNVNVYVVKMRGKEDEMF